MNPILATYAQDVLDKNSDKILGSVTSFVKKAWEKFKVDFNLAFRTYINQSYDKYSKIKTILYRTEPQFIYDFFEVPYLQKGRKERFLADDVGNVISHSHFIIIEGTGGIGKSTLMKHLFLDTLRRGELIPIFIELKDLNDIDEDYSISDFIFKKLTGLGSTIDRGCLDYALKGGSFVFLFDGYDEMISDKRNIFYKKLSTLCDKFPENYYFLSSRPFTDFIEFQRFTVFSVLPFEKEQAIALTSRLPFDSETKQRFALALENGLFDEHESFASNPLLLTLMLLMYDNYAEIPDKLHLFYEKAFETLYNKTYATESADRRIFKSKLSFDPFRSVFAYFCSISYFKHKIEFSRDEMMEYLTKASKTLDKFVSEDYLDDLLNSVCVMYKDGLSYVFTHRSFQEYFTAFFISKLSDDLIKKIVLEYLYKETSRALEDNVIFMLRDMISDRFEEFVLLPLIVRIDKNLAPGEDKFSFYLEKLFRSFSVYNGLPYCQSESLRIEERNHPVQFLYALMTDDNNSNSVNEEKIIRDFIVEKGSFQIYDNCMRYVDCYKFSLARHNSDYASFISLIKSTSIGRRIIKLTHLKEDIEKRHKENMIDLSSLVDG